jgi:RNA polymerase sigma factor (TIGR02999 family)
VANLATLLDRFEQGDRAALDEMVPSIYAELKRLARTCLNRERADHTLQPTALVHEAYIKLLEQRQVDWRNRAHFLGVAANAMRRVLLHHAESRNAQKRDGARQRVTLDEALAALEDSSTVDVLDLNAALERLAALDPRQARVVELRVFGGLTIEEAAEVLELSPATVKRDWNVARLWLRRELT